MMVEARKDRDEEPVADNASDLTRLADASAKLFAEQASAMALMTAYGMTVAAQMTGMMLGALRGPASADGAEEATPAEEKVKASEPKPSAKVVELRPSPVEADAPKAAPVAKVAARPARKAIKPATSKAAPARPAGRSAARGRPGAPGQDDLKKISGVGPRLAQELNDRGIISYADIAGLSKAAVKKLDSELGLEGRIVRDDWAGQAKALSGGKG